jgi:dipeptidyl aminopeptidase/acylaminoacyl peptidase
MGQFSRVMAALPGAARPIACAAQACYGNIQRLWWLKKTSTVLFLRKTGIGYSAIELISWRPSTQKIATLLRMDDDLLSQCELAANDRLLCVRETPTRPPHIISIDTGNGGVTVVADANPEFQAIRLGLVERFEWQTPKFAWNEKGGALEGVYPDRAYGYILYPPNFDRTRRYPVFIDPYVAKGFESSVGQEHAQHVYAANGFIVLKLKFPFPTIDVNARLGKRAMQLTYSRELDFPHLSMLSESTVQALRTVAERGFIDMHRIGIGGVSHGSFVPMYLMMKHDLIAAISISSPSLTAMEYDAPTARVRGWLAGRSNEYAPNPDGEGQEFYQQVDPANHVNAIEAPVLMNLAASEAHAMIRLIRRMADAQKPYDAYLFPNETHCKWQPAHLDAINHRNLDWFRFWLQDYEDPMLEKREQYVRWRELRQLQCRNPRSLRDYCQTPRLLPLLRRPPHGRQRRLAPRPSPPAHAPSPMGTDDADPAALPLRRRPPRHQRNPQSRLPMPG